MKKNTAFLLFIFLFVFCFMSCSSLNPFGEENPFIYSLNQEGIYVFTTKDKTLISEIINIEYAKIDRFSCCINVLTGQLYGAFEGSFSKRLANIALSLSKDFTKVKKNITYFKHKLLGYELFVPANGLVIFASCEIETVVEDTLNKLSGITGYSDNPRVNDKLNYLTFRSLSAITSLYVLSPVSLLDLNLDLSSSPADKFDYILFYSDSKTYNIEFSLKTEDYAESFFTLLKSSYVSLLREQGKNIDFKSIKEDMSKEKMTVYLRNQIFSEEIKDSILQEILQQH